MWNHSSYRQATLHILNVVKNDPIGSEAACSAPAKKFVFPHFWQRPRINESIICFFAFTNNCKLFYWRYREQSYRKVGWIWKRQHLHWSLVFGFFVIRLGWEKNKSVANKSYKTPASAMLRQGATQGKAFLANLSAKVKRRQAFHS